MTEDNCNYTVKCRTCRTAFQVQLFDSHAKNLFVADKKDWYCDKCKKEYFQAQTTEFSMTSQTKGFLELEGTLKMKAWAEKIRIELIAKAEYLKQNLKYDTAAQRQTWDQAYDLLFSEWQAQTGAKWWIDHRKMTVRDISKRITEMTAGISSQAD